MHGSLGRPTFMTNSVSDQFTSDKPQETWTDPITGPEHHQEGEDQESSTEQDCPDKIKLELDTDRWPLLPAKADVPLDQSKHIIRDYVSIAYHRLSILQPSLPVLTIALPPGCYCENPRAHHHVHWKEMEQDPGAYFREDELPDGVCLRDPSHLCQNEVFALWDLWTSHERDGILGLTFSGCDERDRRKHMGRGKDFASRRG